MEDDSVRVFRAAGHAEEGDQERQRYQRRPYPFRLCHRDDYVDDLVFHFHNCVFLLLSVVCFVVVANDVFANSFLGAVAGLVCVDVIRNRLSRCIPEPSAEC